LTPKSIQEYLGVIGGRFGVHENRQSHRRFIKAEMRLGAKWSIARLCAYHKTLFDRAASRRVPMNLLRTTALLLSILCFAGLASADKIKPPQIEHKIKAAFIFKFASYIEWPPSTFANAVNPLMIGVVGADEIFAELTTITRGNRINDRAVEITSLTPDDSLANVHILFIGKDADNHLSQLLANVQSQPILTVTETRGALNSGSIINFVPVNEYIRFEISVENAELNDIKVSARLLGVAQKIETRQL
jgi:hypothetical protein